MVSRSSLRAVMKRKRVGSPRDVNEELVVCPLRGVIFRQLRTQTSCLHSDHRVQMGIEISRAAKNFCCKLVLLRGGSRTLQGMIGKIVKQFAQRLRAMQSSTAEQFFDLFPMPGSVAVHHIALAILQHHGNPIRSPLKSGNLFHVTVSDP